MLSEEAAGDSEEETVDSFVIVSGSRIPGWVPLLLPHAVSTMQVAAASSHSFIFLMINPLFPKKSYLHQYITNEWKRHYFCCGKNFHRKIFVADVTF